VLLDYVYTCMCIKSDKEWVQVTYLSQLH